MRSPHSNFKEVKGDQDKHSEYIISKNLSLNGLNYIKPILGLHYSANLKKKFLGLSLSVGHQRCVFRHNLDAIAIIITIIGKDKR